MNGRDQLVEMLRQHCLSEQLQKKGEKIELFNYIAFTHNLCGHRVTQHCHEVGLEEIGIVSKETIQDCVKQTFNTQGKVDMDKDDNWVLQDMAKRWHQRGTHIAPAVSINEVVYRGQINPDNVFEAICSGFESMPSGCTKWLLKEGIPVKDVGVSTQTLVIIVASVVTLNLVLALLYKQFLNKELQSDMKVQVQSAVSQYVALSSIKELDKNDGTV